MTEQRKAQKTFREPLKYEVGKDIDQATYDTIVVKVADWFRSWRPDHVEPAADARFRIKCCLEGTTLDGKPWYSHWSSNFATRMRMLCRFDVDKMQGIRTADEKKKAAKVRAKAKETATRMAGTAANDANIPELTRRELDGRVTYGDKALPITEGEQKMWNEYRDAYLEQFPELRTINAKGELSMLCDLQILHERNRLKILSGQKVDAADLLETTKMISDLKKALGIHPDQLARRVDKEKSASVADAAARFQALPEALRDKFQLEEFLLLYQMYMTPSPRPDSGGYQLDEVGLFAQTRCRTCACSKCQTRNFVGISIDEVEQHLIQHGVITFESAGAFGSQEPAVGAREHAVLVDDNNLPALTDINAEPTSLGEATPGTATP